VSISIEMLPDRSGVQASPRDRAALRALIRRLPWAALLIAEVIGLTICFELDDSATDWLTRSVETMRKMFQIGIAAISMMVLIYGPALARGLRDLDRGRGVGIPAAAKSLLIHLAAFGVFTWLTSLVFGRVERAWPIALGLSASWAGSGLLTMATWAAIGIPRDVLVQMARRGPGLLLMGVAAGLAIWGLGQLTGGLWLPLGRSALWLVHVLLQMGFSETVYQPERFVVGTPRFQIEIAPACSGFEGIGLMVILTGSYLWMRRHALRFPRALLLIPIGVVAIWLANSVRIAAMIALGSAGYDSIALGSFHSQAGWIAFNALGLGLIAAFHLWTTAGDDSRDARFPSAMYLVPFLAIMATTMTTGAFSEGFDRLYPLRILAGGACLWAFRGEYRGLGWAPGWEAPAIGVLAFAIWMALEPLAPGSSLDSRSEVGAWLADLPNWGAGAWLACRALGSIVVVPLAEELAFRGYLTRRLISADYEAIPLGTFSWISFLASSMLFGMLHGRWIAGGLAGMLYAGALYRRRNLWDAVAAHATTNALIACHVLITGDLGQWV
jgi:exosortase E/protease (VPEID-CTERM system)